MLPEADPFRALVRKELVEATKRAASIAIPAGMYIHQKKDQLTKFTCKACGIALNLENPDCKRCRSRHCMRRTHARRDLVAKVVAALDSPSRNGDGAH